MSDSTLNPRTVDDPRQRPATGAADPAAAEDVDVPRGGSIPGTTDDADPYGLPDDAPAEGRVFTSSGGDWDEIAEEAAELGEERIVVNMGPQHPSTHGVLRLILEIDGETVTEARCGVGYLHTGIEKTMEYRNWVQGVTLCTRMDYLSPLYQEVAYCLGVEKLLGIEDQIPERVHVIRVMMMELNRVASHIVALATGGMEIGALTVMTVGFRLRERVLKLLELVTGLRMNHGYIRPGGLAQDLPPGALDMIVDELPGMYQDISDVEMLSNENPLVRSRLVDTGYLDLTGCMSLGLTGPVLRATGLPHDLRRSQPYCGYEDYEFDVVTWDTCDAYGRFRIREEEMRQSLRIVEQCVKRLRDMPPGPVMVADRKIAWPAQLAIGGDGMGNSLEHIREIMGQSMEALIHHFKLVTEGIRVPAGQVYVAVESPRGELAAHLVSDGGTRPYRAHFRDPSFVNLQAVAAMCEGGQIADVVVAVASLDPVMGGVDR
jgi:NADH-quinone oxidoreductase subunit D